MVHAPISTKMRNPQKTTLLIESMDSVKRKKVPLAHHELAALHYKQNKKDNYYYEENYTLMMRMCALG